jgi:SAM-dependent methyltransferase
MSSTSEIPESSVYVGNELELFNHATRWKGYWGNQIKPYLGKKVLEVGAGIGATPEALIRQDFTFDRWICLEPDPRLCEVILKKKKENQKLDKVEVVTGYLADYKTQDKFDSILYIDVIEHIEDEKSELVRALDYLRPGGKLIIVVPAHQSLYSPFDKAIGHYRRYSRETLKAVIPSNSVIIKNRYLDSLGLLASLTNKLFLKQSYPTRSQITFWDKTIVPLSRLLDRMLFFNAGKSIVLVAEKIS